MDVLKPTTEKKKKRVSKKRAQEIKRRKSSIFQAAVKLDELEEELSSRGAKFEFIFYRTSCVVPIW